MCAGYEPAADSGRVTDYATANPLAITVRRRPGDPCRGWLMAGPLALPVALGRGGIRPTSARATAVPRAGVFRPQAAVVARRPAHSATDLAAGPPHPARRWLVRGPGRPPLQPARSAWRPAARRPAAPRRPPLRLHRRDRPQHPAAGRRPRQRGLHPRRPTWICADRGLRRFECRVPCGAFWRGSGRARAFASIDLRHMRRLP